MANPNHSILANIVAKRYGFLCTMVDGGSVKSVLKRQKIMKLETLKIIIGYPAEGIPTKYYLGRKKINKHQAFKVFLDRMSEKKIDN